MWHRPALIFFFTDISCEGNEYEVYKELRLLLKLLYAISVMYNKEILIIPF